jgi:hypothetical protein
VTARKAAAKTQSWDEFWAERAAARTEVIRGVTVNVPTDLPLNYEQRLGLLGDLGEDSKPEEFEPLIEPLFGEGVFQQWYDAGMGAREFLTIVVWGYAQASGRDVSFAEAYELAMGDDPGKALAPNREARRAAKKTAAKKTASKPRSGATGGPSRRTSSASTGTARRTSRG